MPLFQCLFHIVGVLQRETPDSSQSAAALDDPTSDVIRVNERRSPVSQKRTRSIHSPVSRGLSNPRANESVPAFVSTACAKGPAQCQAAWLKAVNQAHAREHIRSMLLPHNYARLSPAQQLLTLTNQERLDRGLPVIKGLSGQLNQYAMQGAQHEQDPELPQKYNGKVAWATNEAQGEATALEAEYDWMYMDGWGGSVKNTQNVDCTGPNASGCWQHRQDILDSVGPAPQLGAAETAVDGSKVWTELITSPLT